MRSPPLRRPGHASHPPQVQAAVAGMRPGADVASSETGPSPSHGAASGRAGGVAAASTSSAADKQCEERALKIWDEIDANKDNRLNRQELLAYADRKFFPKHFVDSFIQEAGAHSARRHRPGCATARGLMTSACLVRPTLAQMATRMRSWTLPSSKST